MIHVSRYFEMRQRNINPWMTMMMITIIIIMIIVIIIPILIEYLFFYFNFSRKHLTMEQRIFNTTELIRHALVGPERILTDGVIEFLYTELLAELTAGSSPEFGGSFPEHVEFSGSDRTIPFEEGAVGGTGWTRLTPVVMTSPSASPRRSPPLSAAS